MMVPPDHLVHRAFMNQRVAERLSGLVNQKLLPADVPVVRSGFGLYFISFDARSETKQTTHETRLFFF